MVTQESTTPFFYRPVAYFGRTFALTFLFWGVGAYMSFSESLHAYYMLFMLIGLMMPFLFSWQMLAQSGRIESIKKVVLKALFPKDLSLKMLPAMLLVMPLVVLVSIAVSLLFGESTSQLQFSDSFSFSTGVVPVFLLLFLAAFFEELGWRGYAFESLSKGRSLLSASLIFGVLWSAWHLPLLVVNNSYQYEIAQISIWYAINFFVGIVPMSIIISWIYIKNNHSVMIAVVFHFIINLSQEALMLTQMTKSIETGVLALFAAAIVWYERELFFAPAGGKS
jgi:uncharacterized protein